MTKTLLEAYRTPWLVLASVGIRSREWNLPVCYTTVHEITGSLRLTLRVWT
jgi:hypothetical protein